MNDALLVRRVERVGDLLRDGPGLAERNRPARDAIRERRSLDQLDHERGDPPGLQPRGCIGMTLMERRVDRSMERRVLRPGGYRLDDPVDVRDVRMVERREHLRLAFESRQPLGIVGEQVGQDLERDLAAQLGVAGAVDLAHAARAKRASDLIGTEPGAGCERHMGVCSRLYRHRRETGAR